MSRRRAVRGWRARVLGALAALVLALAGCAQLTDIHQRSLIFGLGVDQGPQPGMVTLASQAMHPTEAGGGGGGTGSSSGGAGGAEWKTLVSSGRTFSEALGRMQAQTDRQVFLGQLALILLGTPLAQQGVLHDMDALLRSSQVAENVPVAVVEGQAATLLQNGTQQQVAWKVRRFLTQPRAGQAVLANPFWHFMSENMDLAAATYAPAFTADPKAEGFRFVGTAVFVGGRMVDTLSPAETDALAWVIKRVDFGGVSVGSDGDEIHVAIKGARAAWDLSDPTVPILRLTATGEVTTSPGQSLADRPSGMTQVVEREMTLEIEGVLDRLRGDGADLFGIGELLRQRGALPPGPWPQNFRRMRFAVSVRLQLVPGKIR